MEIIYKCVNVAVKVNDQITYHNNVNSNLEEEQGMASLHSSIDRFYAPTESIPLELTITFDNRSGERTMYAYTLLTLLGVHSFHDLWKLLFDQLIVTPYLSPINDKPKNISCEIENNNNNNIVNSTAEMLNTTSMSKEDRQKSTFCYGVPTWLHTLRQNVNEQLQEYATSVSDSMLTNKKKEDYEVQESNRLVEEIHAMLEGNDKSVIDEASNENININCSMPTQEVRLISVLSSPFAIVVDSVQWHHIEPQSSEAENASTSVQTSQHAENSNSNDYRNSVKSGSDKVDGSSTIPTFVQYTYKFHVTLPEIQCNKVLANMQNAETNIIISNDTTNNENNYYSGKDNNSQRTLESEEKTLLLLLMLQTPLKPNCSVNTDINYRNISGKSNYDSTIFHVEAIRRVLSNSVNNNKYNGLPMGWGSIPISIYRPLFVNHIACSRLRSSAFLLSCTVQNELLSSFSKSLSQSALVLELCNAEIDLRTTQRVPCTQMHHDAMKRELLKRFTTFSKSVVDHKKKMRKTKKKDWSKSNWSKVVNQYNEEINTPDQRWTTTANEKSKSVGAYKIGQGKDESEEELQSTNSIKEQVMSLTSRWGVEYKDETILSICNDCINVIPLSAETAPLPLELHPREAYSFQFMLELRPEVSYWLTQYADELLHSQITETVHTNKIASKTSKPVTQASATATLLSAKKVIQEQQNPLQLLPQQSQPNEHNHLLVKRVDELSTNVQPHRSTSTPFAPLHILDKTYNATDVIDTLSQIYTTNLFLSYALRQVDRDDDQLHDKTQNNNLCKQCQILHLTQPIT